MADPRRRRRKLNLFLGQGKAAGRVVVVFARSADHAIGALHPAQHGTHASLRPGPRRRGRSGVPFELHGSATYSTYDRSQIAWAAARSRDLGPRLLKIADRVGKPSVCELGVELPGARHVEG